MGLRNGTGALAERAQCSLEDIFKDSHGVFAWFFHGRPVGVIAIQPVLRVACPRMCSTLITRNALC